MFSSVFHQLRKTIVKLLLMSSKVLSLRSLPPFIPSTSKWYFASTEQNLNRGRLSLVLNLEHTNLSNCQVYWNVFFPNLLKCISISKKYEIFYYEFSLHHGIVTCCILYVRLWCITLSTLFSVYLISVYYTIETVLVGIIFKLIQFILYSYSIYCPWPYVFEIHLHSITKGAARNKA